jgi:hypothetical protein
MLKRSVLATGIVAGFFLGASPSSAQGPGSPEALQSANELVTVFGGSMLSDFSAKMTAQIWPSIEKSLRAAYPNVDAATVTELRRQFEQAQLKNITDNTKNMAAVYARNFTAQELRDMLAYYRSPTGAKALRVMPQVTAEVYASLMPAVQASSQQLKRTFLDIVSKRGVSLAGSWCSRERPNAQELAASITQKGPLVSFRNEHGQTSRGHFENASVVIADDWGSLRGQLTADNNRINWANGGVWQRKPKCGQS